VPVFGARGCIDTPFSQRELHSFFPPLYFLSPSKPATVFSPFRSGGIRFDPTVDKRNVRNSFVFFSSTFSSLDGWVFGNGPLVSFYICQDFIPVCLFRSQSLLPPVQNLSYLWFIPSGSRFRLHISFTSPFSSKGRGACRPQPTQKHRLICWRPSPRRGFIWLLFKGAFGTAYHDFSARRVLFVPFFPFFDVPRFEGALRLLA